MAETTNIPPRKGNRWLRVLGFLAGGLLLLLVIGYFVVTSGAFFNSVILPKVSVALNADVTVRSASISPFSQVVLQGLTVTPKGAEPLAQIEKVTARYSLMDIIKGKIVVDEATLDSPSFTLVQNSDGTSNLDPLLKSQDPSTKAEEKTAGTTETTQLQIEKIAINNGQLTVIKKYTGELRDVTQVTDLNLAITDVRNGAEGKAVLSARLSMDNHPPADGTNAPATGKLAGAVNGNFTFKVSPELKVETLSGQTKMEVQSADGTFATLAALSAELVCEISPTEIKEMALRLRRGADSLAELHVHGPFDAAKTEGELVIVLTGVESKTLNTFASSPGLDFGSTSVGATNLVKISKGGTLIDLTGALDLNRLTVKQNNQVTPALDLHLRFQTTIDRSNQLAKLQAFTLDGDQDGRPLVRGGLTSPMTIALGGQSNAIGDSALQLSVTNLNLADWQALAGQTNLGGTARLDLTLLSQQGGDGLTLSLKSSVLDLRTAVGSNQLSGVDVRLNLNSQVHGQDRFDLERCQFELLHQRNRVLAATVSGIYQMAAKTADLNVNLENNLPQLLRMLPQADLEVTGGLLQLQTRIQQTNAAYAVRGNFQLRDFSGMVSGSKFSNYTTAATFDLGADEKMASLRNISMTVTNGGLSGGQVMLSGNYNPVTTNATLTLEFDRLNEKALEPFLNGPLGETKLLSIMLAGSTKTTYTPQNATVDAAITITNLVVQEPNKPSPNPALAMRLRADVVKNNNNLELRQVGLGLTPTDRAKNELSVTGRLNLADTNATEGSIKITAESLDVTPYYNLFAGSPTATNAPTPQTPAPPTNDPTSPPTESPATSLPLRNFDVELDVGALFLREIEIKKWHAKTRLDVTNITLDPFQLEMNGSPISVGAKVNVGVPGYAYDLSFDVAKLPVEPLANTFAPDQRGMYKGDLITKANIKGLGTTGPNLRQHLNAQVGFSFTNAELHILSPKLKKILTPIATFLTVPDLMKSPITFANLSATAAGGKVDLSRVMIVSAAFVAETSGQVPLADEVMKSPINNWPVAFSLRRSMAETIRVLPKDTNSTAYVRLPDFIKITGTLDDPSPKIDKAALAGSVLEKFGDKIPGLDDKTGNVLKGLGGLLSGNKGASNVDTNNPASTNQPAAAPKFNPLDLLKKPKK